MKKILFAISLLNLLQSCQDETLKPKQSLNEISVENGRLSFKDTKTYFETISALNMMSETEVLTWEKTHKINSLAAYFIKAKDSDFEIEHVDLINFPVGHTSVLNSNAEVKIGDTIVWYNQGI